MLIMYCLFAPSCTNQFSPCVDKDKGRNTPLHLFWPLGLSFHVGEINGWLSEGPLPVLSPSPSSSLIAQFRGPVAFIACVYGRTVQSATWLSGGSLRGAEKKALSRFWVSLIFFFFLFRILSTTWTFGKCSALLLLSQQINRHRFHCAAASTLTFPKNATQTRVSMGDVPENSGPTSTVKL